MFSTSGTLGRPGPTWSDLRDTRPVKKRKVEGLGRRLFVQALDYLVSDSLEDILRSLQGKRTLRADEVVIGALYRPCVCVGT